MSDSISTRNSGPQSVAKPVLLLKSMAHSGRLSLLAELIEGERSVSELEQSINRPQAAVSQMLGRLRQDGLVQARREGKTVYYALTSPEAQKMLQLLGLEPVRTKQKR